MPQLLCPRCKATIPVSADSQGGVVDCPICGLQSRIAKKIPTEDVVKGLPVPPANPETQTPRAESSEPTIHISLRKKPKPPAPPQPSPPAAPQSSKAVPQPSLPPAHQGAPPSSATAPPSSATAPPSSATAPQRSQHPSPPAPPVPSTPAAELRATPTDPWIAGVAEDIPPPAVTGTAASTPLPTPPRNPPRGFGTISPRSARPSLEPHRDHLPEDPGGKRSFLLFALLDMVVPLALGVALWKNVKVGEYFADPVWFLLSEKIGIWKTPVAGLALPLLFRGIVGALLSYLQYMGESLAKKIIVYLLLATGVVACLGWCWRLVDSIQRSGLRLQGESAWRLGLGLCFILVHLFLFGWLSRSKKIRNFIISQGEN